MIRSIRTLQEKSRQRKKEKAFVVEGCQEVKLALQSGFAAKTLLICPEFFGTETIKLPLKADCIEVTPEVYRKLAYRDSTEGIIAVFESKACDLSSLSTLTDTPLYLVAEAPEKPGNIGALLRTADAAGIDALLIINPKTDIFNPNTIRSSVGTVFTIPIATGTIPEIVRFLRKQQCTIFGAALDNAVSFTDQNYLSASAIVVGTESTGLTSELLDQTDVIIKIPMLGQVDSLNVSVAASILVYEARRQRNLSGEF